MMSLEDACEILTTCVNLRHIKFEWAYHPWTDLSPSHLHKALLQHANTLITLRLNMIEVRFGDGFVRPFHRLGSLRGFTFLENLSLCQYTFLGSDYLDLYLLGTPGQWQPQWPVPGTSTLISRADVLPRNLKDFTLILGSHDDWILSFEQHESATALNGFVDECKQELPEMRVAIERAGSK